MGVYVGENTFHAEVYQFEETDLVLGGPEGIDNLPLKHLADRTIWLREQIGLVKRFSDGLTLSASSPINAAMIGKHITVYANAILNLTLDNANTFVKGSIIPISSFCDPGTVVNVKTSAGQKFYDAGTGEDVLSMHHKEHLWLIVMDDHFRVISKQGNFDCAGEEIKSRKNLNNTLRLTGQLLSRAAYPRLWKFASTLTTNQEIVSESLWFYDAFTYRGCFSLGDGATNFRIPDERGMFDRMIDLGRGVDLGRTHNFPGGYEADELKSHNHNTKGGFNQGGYDGGNNDFYRGRSSNGFGNGGLLEATGGVETRPKNVGKLNLIKF
jgi:hypothetical protein